MINTRTISYPFDNNDLLLKIEYDASDNPIYVGQAAPGTADTAAAWQIRKYTYDGNNNIAAREFAAGDNSYNKIWNNRASYDYL